jgi:hypothetical protein
MVSGVQAMLHFSSTYFSTEAGHVNVAPGGSLVWDDPAWQVFGDPGYQGSGVAGDLDTLITVNGYAQYGTNEKARVAVITLDPIAEGVTQVVFRADDPLSETKQTYFADMSLPANSIWPVKMNSTNITIDGTAPVITITSPATNPFSTNAATQTITATAADPIPGGVSSGIDSFTMNGGAFAGTATVVLHPGVNTFEFVATDKAGNPTTQTLTITYNQAAPTITMPMSLAPSGNASASYPAWDANAIAAVTGGLSTLGDGYFKFDAITTPQDYGAAIVTGFHSWKGLVTADAEYGTRIHAVWMIDNGVQSNAGAAKLDLTKIWAKGVNNFVGSDNVADNGFYVHSDYQVSAVAGSFTGTGRLKGYDRIGSAWVEVTSGTLADRIVRDFGEGIEPPSGSIAGQATLNAMYKNMSGAVAWPMNSEVDAAPVKGKRAKLSAMDFIIEYRDGLAIPSASLTQTAQLASADNTAPELAITSLTDLQKTNVAAQTIAGTVTDNQDLASGVREAKVFLNGALVNTYNTSDPVNFSDAVTLVEGNNAIRVEATDFAGNPSSKTITVLLDTAIPVITIGDNFGSNSVLQGTYTVTVSVTDEALSSGLAGAPTINWDGLSASAGTEEPAGTWTYTVTVDQSTANNGHTITADISDVAGNAAVQKTRTISVNKNQITGSVTLEGFVGTGSLVNHVRVVTFSINGGATSNQTLTFVGDTAPFTLVNVPDGANALSAKTAWNLRSKVSLGGGGTDNQWTANFMGADKLLGGDLNGSNAVTILDYSPLKAKWAAPSTTVAGFEAVDINGDGYAYTEDYNIMKLNWLKTGDPQ